MAIVPLMKMGNLGFKTLHDTGCVDFVTIDKTGKRKGHHISRLRTPLQQKLGVNIIYVDVESQEIQVVQHGRRT